MTKEKTVPSNDNWQYIAHGLLIYASALYFLLTCQLGRKQKINLVHLDFLYFFFYFKHFISMEIAKWSVCT